MIDLSTPINDVSAMLLGLDFVVDFSMWQILYCQVRMIIQPCQTKVRTYSFELGLASRDEACVDREFPPLES